MSVENLCPCGSGERDDCEKMIFCEGCLTWFHSACVSLTDEDVAAKSTSNDNWYCQRCVLCGTTQRIEINTDLHPCPHCPAENTKVFKTKRGLQIHIGSKHKAQRDKAVSIQSTNTERDFTSILATSKQNIRFLRRIPKGARRYAADKLSGCINEAIANNCSLGWESVFLFAFKALQIPAKTTKKSLTSKVKDNISQFAMPTTQKTKPKPFNRAKRAEAKVADFDTKGAVRLLSSSDTLANTDANTLLQLQAKHPSPSRELQMPDPPTNEEEYLNVTMDEVKNAINSFPSGSASGIDGLSPQHLKDLITYSCGDSGGRLLASITKLCNFLLSGRLNEETCQTMYGATLCALNKKDGGLRPIAVGNVFRRLTSKLACIYAREVLTAYFAPHQLGFGTRQGCEAAIHATRTYITNPKNSTKVVLKIDFKNAFNSIERDGMLNEIKKKTPLLFPYLWQCYAQTTHLFFGNNIIPSQVGCQQGDPAGPLAFSLVIQPLINSMLSELNIWYLDDGTLADDATVVLQDFKALVTQAKSLGLEINPNKCELYFCSKHPVLATVTAFQSIAPGIRVLSEGEMNLLGSPITEEGFPTFVEEKFESLDYLLNQLNSLNAHVAYFLLKHCFSIPKLTYLMRTTPMWKFPEFMRRIDNSIKNSLETILNIHLEDGQWIQATLPIRFGGLGIRKVEDIALPAFLASCFGANSLVSIILNTPVDEIMIHHGNEAVTAWNKLNPDTLPTIPYFQKNWDTINTSRILEEKLSFENPTDIARFLAIQTKESSAWLHAIPSPNIGTFMEDSTLRVCIALRLGCDICRTHICKCESTVSPDGLHGLNCSNSLGRISRHNEINNIVQRALSSINVPSTREPVGLTRSDGKRPDGVTLVPWTKGHCLVWDVTVSNTLADSYIASTSTLVASAAELACKRKHSKYTEIKEKNYHFVPLAFETMGSWSAEARKLINKIGSDLAKLTADPRSRAYLIQRISLAIQRGNAACVLETLPSSIAMEEVFYI